MSRKHVTPGIYLDAVKKARIARACEESLYEFVKHGWETVEPGVPFVDSFHIRVICEHLEAVHRGDIRKLLVNIPPRHSKSTIVSILYPAWCWVNRPSDRILSASYGVTLAIKDAMASRRVIQSQWYQDNWGEKFTFLGESNAKTRFDNSSQGYRIITSTGSATTGLGGSLLLLDDPHGAMDAQSDALRQTAVDWFLQAWSTRLNNPKKDAMVTIMQRLHAEDVSGVILDQGGWEHLCIPAEFDGVRRSTSLGNYDPRTKKGELLCPDRFGRVELDGLKKSLGEYGSAGQLQQQPSPEGGGILKPGHMKMWAADKPIPALDFVITSFDTAFTDNTANDPTAQTAFGFFTHNGQQCTLILDYWAEHMSYPQLRSRMIEEYNSLYGEDEFRRGRRADRVLIEEKGSGIAIIQELRQAGVPVVTYNPGKASKIMRAHQVAPILESGCIYYLESRKSPGEPISWIKPLLKELEMFPNGKHDDGVDTFTQGLIYARDCQLLTLEVTTEVEEDIDPDYYYQKRQQRVNPYAC